MMACTQDRVCIFTASLSPCLFPYLPLPHPVQASPCTTHISAHAGLDEETKKKIREMKANLQKQRKEEIAQVRFSGFRDAECGFSPHALMHDR